MPLDLSDTLVIGISATALFDLSEADKLFRTEFAKDRDNAIDVYRRYMLERENEPLATGTGLPLVRSLLRLKHLSPDEECPLVKWLSCRGIALKLDSAYLTPSAI